MGYDAIIVGARVAGASTAMLLARRGYRVLLLDRDAYPHGSLSTQYLQPAGAAYLRRWGLLARLEATGCPSISEVQYDFGSFHFRAAPPPLDGVSAGYAPRRAALDKLLVDAAIEAGAEFRSNCEVDRLLHESDRPVGVRTRLRQTVTEEHAGFIVGAEGMRSLVARAVDARVYHARPALSSMHVSCWSGLTVRCGEWWIRPGYSFLLFPAGDGLTTVAMSTAIAEYPRIRSDVDRAASEAASAVPDLRERLAAGQRETRWTGTADLPNFFRKPFGNRWALVGDAGFHQDPVTAQGIAGALRDAQLLADALDAAFAGRADAGLALNDYERSRNGAVSATYKFTCERAAHGPLSPAMLRLLLALASKPEPASQFVGLLAGTSRWEEFFHPDNLGQLVPDAAALPAERFVCYHAGSL